MSDVLKRIQALNLQLPPTPTVVGSYLPFLKRDNILYLSGQLSKDVAGQLMTGRLGKGLDVQQGKQAAELAALNVLSLIEKAVGLDEGLERIIKVVGYVQCDEDFNEIPQVINGASDLFFKILGDKGKHVRLGVGMISLPLDAVVELEVTVQLKS